MRQVKYPEVVVQYPWSEEVARISDKVVEFLYQRRLEEARELVGRLPELLRRAFAEVGLPIDN